MTDLISRSELSDALRNCDNLDDVWEVIDKLPAIMPQVVANISGGVLQGASADYPVAIYVLDFDLDCVDHDATGIEVDGDLSYLGQESAEVDPDFVRRVVEAPEVYLHDGSPVE